jgi:hypothetical protein
MKKLVNPYNFIKYQSHLFAYLMTSNKESKSPSTVLVPVYKATIKQLTEELDKRWTQNGQDEVFASLWGSPEEFKELFGGSAWPISDHIPPIEHLRNITKTVEKFEKTGIVFPAIDYAEKALDLKIDGADKSYESVSVRTICFFLMDRLTKFKESLKTLLPSDLDPMWSYHPPSYLKELNLSENAQNVMKVIMSIDNALDYNYFFTDIDWEKPVLTASNNEMI